MFVQKTYFILVKVMQIKDYKKKLNVLPAEQHQKKKCAFYAK